MISHCSVNSKKMARVLARSAIRSLYYEVKHYPKPGLVSFVDQGAHKDMDGALFFKSLFSLRHYFYKISLLTSSNAPLEDMVKLAIQAEENMLVATDGINTHRGAIFALGIFCSSVIKLMLEEKDFSEQALQLKIIALWSDYLLTQHQTNPSSHGQQLKNQYKINSALEIAASGYFEIFKVFETLQSMHINNPVIYNIKAYALLLLKIDDTNILHREGKDGLLYAKQQAKELLSYSDDDIIEQAIKLHIDFSHKNISPGGVADMMGVIFFFKEIFCQKLVINLGSLSDRLTKVEDENTNDICRSGIFSDQLI